MSKKCQKNLEKNEKSVDNVKNVWYIGNATQRLHR